MDISQWDFQSKKKKKEEKKMRKKKEKKEKEIHKLEQEFQNIIISEENQEEDPEVGTLSDILNNSFY